MTVRQRTRATDRRLLDDRKYLTELARQAEVYGAETLTVQEQQIYRAYLDLLLTQALTYMRRTR